MCLYKLTGRSGIFSQTLYTAHKWKSAERNSCNFSPWLKPFLFEGPSWCGRTPRGLVQKPFDQTETPHPPRPRLVEIRLSRVSSSEINGLALLTASEETSRSCLTLPCSCFPVTGKKSIRGWNILNQRRNYCNQLTPNKRDSPSHSDWTLSSTEDSALSEGPSLLLLHLQRSLHWEKGLLSKPMRVA